MSRHLKTSTPKNIRVNESSQDIKLTTDESNRGVPFEYLYDCSILDSFTSLTNFLETL